MSTHTPARGLVIPVDYPDPYGQPIAENTREF